MQKPGLEIYCMHALLIVHTRCSVVKDGIYPVLRKMSVCIRCNSRRRSMNMDLQPDRIFQDPEHRNQNETFIGAKKIV